MTKCISPSSTKEFFSEELHIDDSLVKPITLPENAPVRLIDYFLSDSNIWYSFGYFVVPLLVATFYAQMFFLILIASYDE